MIPEFISGIFFAINSYCRVVELITKKSIIDINVNAMTKINR